MSTHHVLINLGSRAISHECLYPESRACTLPNAFRCPPPSLFKSSLSATSLLQRPTLVLFLLTKKMQRGFSLLQKKGQEVKIAFSLCYAASCYYRQVHWSSEWHHRASSPELRSASSPHSFERYVDICALILIHFGHLSARPVLR